MLFHEANQIVHISIAGILDWLVVESSRGEIDGWKAFDFIVIVWIVCSCIEFGHYQFLVGRQLLC